MEKTIASISELVDTLGSQAQGSGPEKQDEFYWDDAESQLEARLQDLLSVIQNHKYCLERKQENIREDLKRLRSEQEQGRQDLLNLHRDKGAKERTYSELCRKLDQTERTLEEEMAKNERLLEEIPKLSKQKKILYLISRMTLDKKTQPNHLKGFIVNSRKNDLNTFDFKCDEGNVSHQFIRDYLWDVIAVGADPAWDKS